MADDVTPDTARTYIKTLADLYGEATIDLLRIIAQRVANGLDTTAQYDKLADILALRAQARRVAARLSDQLDGEVAAIVAAAYDHGADAAAAHLAGLVGLRELDQERAATQRLVGTKRTTVEALARALTTTMRDLPILRAVDDAYRAATVAASVPAAAGSGVRRAATQRALDQMAARGLTGFVDKSGRRWGLTSYAEMATRTTVAQAAVQGSVDRIREVTPFVRVSDTRDECDLCRQWEGAILLTVNPSDLKPEHRAVRYDATLKKATGAGLFHPNCTHGLGAYIPGLSRDGQQRPTRTPDPQGYADRQEQRRLERGVREWRQREAVAIDDAARAKAQAKVAEWQQRLAEHVQAANRNRRYDREALRPAG